MKEVKIEDIYNRINELNFIDIRENYLYNLGTIPNSKNIPLNFLLMNPQNYLKKDETYYIFCSMGLNSRDACNKLSKEGYDVVNVIGGYNAYKLFSHLTR